MGAANIFIGANGIVQMGYLPVIDENEENGINFLIRTVIAMGDSWLLLDEDDVREMFYLLRIFNFSYRDGMLVVELYDKSDESYEIAFSPAALIELMALEEIVKGYMFERRVLKEHYHNELISAIDKVADECRNNGLLYIGSC